MSTMETKATETKATSKKATAKEAVLIYQNGNPTHDVRIYAFNGYKFRMEFPHKNGLWCSVLRIMGSDGTWKSLETNITMNVEFKNLYFMDGRDTEACLVENNRSESAFLEYIKKVYA